MTKQDEPLQPNEIAALDPANLRRAYDEMHLLLCDRMAELYKAVGDHQNDAFREKKVAEMRLRVADICGWIATVDRILLGYNTGHEYLGGEIKPVTLIG